MPPVKPVVPAKSPLPKTMTVKVEPKPTQPILKVGDIDPQTGKKIKYPEVRVELRTKNSPLGPLTEAEVDEILGWEDEEMFAKRQMGEHPELIQDQCLFGDNYLFAIPDSKPLKKINCSNNMSNRPLSIEWARSLAQDQLYKEWAGMSDDPLDTINGETVIIGRCGSIISAQHRLIGFKLACMYWRGRESEKWKLIWSEQPTFPCIIVYGVSEKDKIVRTIDNTRPRTLTDTITTSPTFRDLDRDAKNECSRMLATAVDFIWKRVRMGGTGGIKYQTHSSSHEFLAKHERLVECVRHIYNENKGKTGTLGKEKEKNVGRTFSAKKLSPGECAGLMFLMGCSNTNPDDYYCTPVQVVNGVKRRSEKSPDEYTQDDLNWDWWDKAQLFWTLLADACKDRPNDHTLVEVWKVKRPALGLPLDKCFIDNVFPPNPKVECHSSREERIAVLCMAWAHFTEGTNITTDNLRLVYELDPADDGTVAGIELKGVYQIDGIDQGDIPPKGDTPKKEKAPKEEKTKGKGSKITPPSADTVKAILPSKGPVTETPEQEKARRQAVLTQSAKSSMVNMTPQEILKQQKNDKLFEEIKANRGPVLSEGKEEEVPLSEEENEELEEQEQPADE